MKIQCTATSTFSRFWKVVLLLGASCVSAAIQAQPVISNGPRGQFVWEGKSVTLSASVKGTAPLSYQWQLSGTDISNATNRTLTISQAQVSDSGLYRIVVADPTGAAMSEVADVEVRPWPQPTGPAVQDLALLDTDMQSVLVGHGIPGGSIAVVKDGRLVFARGYGWGDVERNERFYPDSQCQIASLSKTITTAVIMKMVEAGKLSLTNRAFDFLDLDAPHYPGAVFDTRLTNITVRQLLSHTAGWVASSAKNPRGAAGFDAAFWPDLTLQEMGLTDSATPDEFVRWMLGKPLQAKPGSQFAYSNVGFIVAGRVVESITAQRFEKAAQQLLANAGITRTRLGGNALTERLPGESVCYLHPSITVADIVGEDNWAEPKPLDSNLPYAYPLTTLESAGGFVACSIDHARFIASIDGLASFPDILTTKSVSAMASGMMGWDSFLSSGENPETGIWAKLGVLPGAVSRGVKWRNGVVFVFLLNSWDKTADSELHDRLTSTFARVSWPTNDLFPATLSYEAWRMKHFSIVELTDSAISGEQADPDGDGIPNLLEYAQGSSPVVENAPIRLTLKTDATGATISFRRLFLEHELEYRLDSSMDLLHWTAVDGEETQSSFNNDGTTTVVVHAQEPADALARFFRLRVSRK